MHQVLGEDLDTINSDMIDKIIAHYPSGTTLKTLKHIIQNVEANRFQRYDYGTQQNREIYGSDIPPAYNLSSISGMKIFYVTGDLDDTSVPEDNAVLRDQLGDNIISHKNYSMGHYSMYYSRDLPFAEDVLIFLEQNSWNETFKE